MDGSDFSAVAKLTTTILPLSLLLPISDQHMAKHKMATGASKSRPNLLVGGGDNHHCPLGVHGVGPLREVHHRGRRRRSGVPKFDSAVPATRRDDGDVREPPQAG